MLLCRDVKKSLKIGNGIFNATCACCSKRKTLVIASILSPIQNVVSSEPTKYWIHFDSQELEDILVKINLQGSKTRARSQGRSPHGAAVPSIENSCSSP